MTTPTLTPSEALAKLDRWATSTALLGYDFDRAYSLAEIRDALSAVVAENERLTTRERAAKIDRDGEHEIRVHWQNRATRAESENESLRGELGRVREDDPGYAFDYEAGVLRKIEAPLAAGRVGAAVPCAEDYLRNTTGVASREWIGGWNACRTYAHNLSVLAGPLVAGAGEAVVEESALAWMRATAKSLGVADPDDGLLLLSRALTDWIDTQRRAAPTTLPEADRRMPQYVFVPDGSKVVTSPLPEAVRELAGKWRERARDSFDDTLYQCADELLAALAPPPQESKP
jgi:hypothetical protein